MELIITTCLLARRKIKNDTPMTIVCQFHCKKQTMLHKKLLSELLIFFGVKFCALIQVMVAITPWCAVLKTECRTETASVFLEKLTMPSSPLSCCRLIVMEAPAMNPTMAA